MVISPWVLMPGSHVLSSHLTPHICVCGYTNPQSVLFWVQKSHCLGDLRADISGLCSNTQTLGPVTWMPSRVQDLGSQARNPES